MLVTDLGSVLHMNVGTVSSTLRGWFAASTEGAACGRHTSFARQGISLLGRPTGSRTCGMEP
jgi:hypothetical protein